VHGKNVLLEEILDWRPFDYYTMDVKPPVPLLKPFRVTCELEDTPEGTRVTEYSAPAPGFGQQLFFSITMRMMAGGMHQAVEALRSALRNAAAPQP
jgi:hypothetical protein